MTTGEGPTEAGSGAPRRGRAPGPAARRAGSRHGRRSAPPPPRHAARARPSWRRSTGSLGALEVRTKEVRSSSATSSATARPRSSSRSRRRARRREALEKRLYGGQVVAARELQAMNEEVKHLARHINELEDREIEVMEALEPLDGELRAGDVTRSALDKDAERLRAAIENTERALDARDRGRRPGRAPLPRRRCVPSCWPATSSCAPSSAARGRLAWWGARAAGAIWHCRPWSSTASARHLPTP